MRMWACVDAGLSACMDFDPKDYLDHLSDFDASDEEKLAVIEAMWMLAQGVVDRAFGLTSGQQLWAIPANDNGMQGAAMVKFNTVSNAPETAANDNDFDQPKKGTALK